MLVTIYTPKSKLFDSVDARAVYLPATNGDMQILNNHIPVVTSLKPGSIFIDTTEGGRIEVSLDSGYAQFSNNDMTIVIEKTSLSHEELKKIQDEAESSKDAVIRDDIDITEEEFENYESSERH